MSLKQIIEKQQKFENKKRTIKDTDGRTSRY